MRTQEGQASRPPRSGLRGAMPEAIIARTDSGQPNASFRKIARRPADVASGKSMSAARNAELVIQPVVNPSSACQCSAPSSSEYTTSQEFGASWARCQSSTAGRSAINHSGQDACALLRLGAKYCAVTAKPCASQYLACHLGGGHGWVRTSPSNMVMRSRSAVRSALLSLGMGRAGQERAVQASQAA